MADAHLDLLLPPGWIPGAYFRLKAFRRSLGISESAISFCTSRLFVQRNAAPFCGALGKDGLNSFPWEFYFDTVRLQMGICHILSQLVMFLSLCRLGESCL